MPVYDAYPALLKDGRWGAKIAKPEDRAEAVRYDKIVVTTRGGDQWGGELIVEQSNGVWEYEKVGDEDW